MSPSWINFNPFSGEPLCEHVFSTNDELESALAGLKLEFQNFRKKTVNERADGLVQLAKLIRADRGALALGMAREMGKPIQQGLAELEKCARTCEYYSEVGNRLLMSQELQAHYDRTLVLKQPLGIILAVMPWNFPFWQVIRCAVPAWLSGNVILLKHAPIAQGTAVRIQELVCEAFGSSPLVQAPLTHEQVALALSDHRVRGLSFTGSARAGSHLASLAGLHLKKCLLELGGSDPYIILEDADLELASDLCVKSRFQNSGQSCISAKRFLIHESIYTEFKQVLLQKISKLRLGNPEHMDTDLGPLAEERLRSLVQSQLDQSILMGAQIVYQERFPEFLQFNKGYFMAPTVVEQITASMPLISDECFGPVMPLQTFTTLEQALELANSSRFGLGAALFTRKPEIHWRLIAEGLDVGMVSVNDMVQSDPRVPFGGIKDSGWGRELGEQGLLEFVNIKSLGFRRSGSLLGF